MSTTDSYERHDAVSLAALVAKGEVSPEELLEAAIARVEARNPAINAVVIPMYEEYIEPVKEFAELIVDGERPLEESLKAILAEVYPQD